MLSTASAGQIFQQKEAIQMYTSFVRTESVLISTIQVFLLVRLLLAFQSFYLEIGVVMSQIIDSHQSLCFTTVTGPPLPPDITINSTETHTLFFTTMQLSFTVST